MSFKLKIDNHILEVDLASLKLSVKECEKGRFGSLLHLLTHFGLRIQHTCGGIGACTTCHVYVHEGLDACSPLTAAEKKQLPDVFAKQNNSRLACQCVPDGTHDVHIEIP
ncbi:MAG: (2Fe-2S)-binding protein [Deltaproteobacteria bacterium]|nr:(2Fe-2S)-binding protein [Deltaproteobacteria bacterium]